MLITIDNQTSFQVPTREIESISSSLTHRDIELIVCDNNTIRDINSKYRGIEKSTDVLSFPIDGEFDILPLGSIVISYEYAISKANEFDHTPQDEFILLFIHGVLHLLGYDHEIDHGEMRAEEERIIKIYDLPTSLIVRTSNQ